MVRRNSPRAEAGVKSGKSPPPRGFDVGRGGFVGPGEPARDLPRTGVRLSAGPPVPSTPKPKRVYVLNDSLVHVATYPGPLAADTETSGLRWWEDSIGVVSFAWGWGSDEAYATRDVEPAIMALRARMVQGFPTIFHNSPFDLHFLKQRGLDVDWRYIRDTLLMARLRNNLERHDLDSLGMSTLGIEKGKSPVKDWLRKDKKAFLTEHGRKANFLDVPDDILLPYATRDASLTWKLHEVFKQAPDSLLPREMRLRELMFDAECRGIRVNLDMAQERYEWAKREQEAIEKRLVEMRGKDINFDSDKQLGEWLYGDLGLKAVSFTPGGQPQVNEYNLASNPHPVTRLLITRNKRVKSAEFFLSYLTLADRTGRIHPTINTMQARTHRFSASDPNVQQVPVRNDRFHTREVFEADWLISADYDKQELRIAAEEAGDRPLLSDIDAGVDVYSKMAAAMLNKPLNAVTGNERQAAKVAVLSMIYGAGAPKVGESFTVNTGRPYSTAQAKGIRDNFYAAHPDIKQLMRRTQNDVKWNGGVRNRWGRWLNVEFERAYVATDYLIQSSGRDVLADAILNLAEILPRHGGYLLWPVHDEALMVVPEEPSPALMDEIASAMKSYKFSLPLTATPKAGRNMSQVK